MRHTHRTALHHRTGVSWGALLSSLWLVTAGFLMAGGLRCASAQLLTGDILVIDDPCNTCVSGALLLVNPVDGTRTVLNDFSNATQGHLGRNPVDVAVETAGTILILDQDGGTGDFPALFRIDPATGFRTLLSDFGNPAQGLVIAGGVENMALEATGAILITDPNDNSALLRVNPMDGSRIVLSDFANSNQGPLGLRPVGVAVEATGTILVTDGVAGTAACSLGFQCGALFRVDPESGTRTLLSDLGDATQGPLGETPTDVAVEASGTILVADDDAGTPDQFNQPLGALFRIDPVTGFRTLLSDFGNPAQGPVGGYKPAYVAVEGTGTILVSDRDNTGFLFRVDPITGDRTVLSRLQDLTQGPASGHPGPFGVAVVRNRLFSALSARLTVELNPATNTQTLQVTAPFTLAADSDGINPLTETVAFRVGTFAGILPPGAFTLARRGRYTFTGNIDGVPTTVQIRLLRDNQYEASLSAAVDPRSVFLLLQIGDDAGVVGILP